MGLTYGFYLRSTKCGYCRYDDKVSKISYERDWDSEQKWKYLEDHYCSHCKFNALLRHGGCWMSCGVDRFLAWSSVVSPKLKELFKKSQLKQYNGLQEAFSKFRTSYQMSDRAWKVIGKLPIWILGIWDAYDNFILRDFKLILTPQQLKEIVLNMNFKALRRMKPFWYYNSVSYCFLTFALKCVEMDVPMYIAY
jgi:hypothetical protein